MDGPAIERAIAAATQLAVEAKLAVDHVAVVHNSNKLALRLMPCDVFARVAVVGEEVAALEVELSSRLGAIGGPVAWLDPRVEPRVYDTDGLAVTFWRFYEPPTTGAVSPTAYAATLCHLHAAMREVEVATPHFTDRVAEAEHLVASRERTPALADADRELVRSTLWTARQAIDEFGAAEQLLHGEPHPGNLLSTDHGPLFIDLETCCRGPIEFDLAHVPGEVASRYDGADRDLLTECRRLVLAMVAAWRWDAGDQFPDGHRAGTQLLAVLRDGPPWPTLDALDRRPTVRDR